VLLIATPNGIVDRAVRRAVEQQDGVSTVRDAARIG
jgi:hypothetical protein